MEKEDLTTQHVMRYNPSKLEVREKERREFWVTGYEFHDGLIAYINVVNKDNHPYSISDLKDIKLILRPLSQLAETITHEGREFVPLVELLRVFGVNPDEYNHHEFHETRDGIIYIITSSNGGIEFISYDFDEFIFMNSDCIPLSHQLQLFNLLHKWQFDLYGFLESSQAVEMGNSGEMSR